MTPCNVKGLVVQLIPLRTNTFSPQLYTASSQIQLIVLVRQSTWSQQNTEHPFQVTGSHWIISIPIECQLPSTKWQRDNVNNYWLMGRVKLLEVKTGPGPQVLYLYNQTALPFHIFSVIPPDIVFLLAGVCFVFSYPILRSVIGF